MKPLKGVNQFFKRWAGSKLAAIGLILLSHLGQLSRWSGAGALKCYDCTNMEGWDGFEASCIERSEADAGALKGRQMNHGFAGCLKVDVTSEFSEAFVIRTGYYNKQVEGRVLSCYHQEPDFKVPTNVEKMKFATMKQCYACDDKDGCNGCSLPRFTWPLFLLTAAGSMVWYLL